MSSKPARRRELIDIVKEIKRQNQRNNGIQRQNYSGLASGDFGASTSSSSSGSGTSTNTSNTQGLLKTAGDTMMGPIAFSRKNIAITSNTIDISKASYDGYTSFVTAVDPLLPPLVNLNTIQGAQFNGQILYLETITGTTIRLKHGVDNIIIPDTTDYDLIPRSIAVLIFDTTWTPSGKWVLVSAFVRDTTGGGSGANQSLSNLTSPTSINQHLLFSTTGFNIGDDTNPVNNLFVEELKLKIGTVTTNIPMLTAIDANSMKLNVNTAGKISFTVLNSEVGRVDSSGFHTSFNLVAVGTGTFGGTLTSGSHFGTSSTVTTLASSSSTDISSAVTSITSPVINLGVVNVGDININTNLDGSGGNTPNISDFGDIECDKIICRQDNLTYIDLGTGTGDIEIRTSNTSDPITIQTTGNTSSITLNASGTGSDISTNATNTNTSSVSGFSFLIGALSGISLGNASILTSMSGHLRLYNRSDATRGAAGTAGRIIYNTSDGKINIDNGTNWTLADGTVT